MTIRQKNRPKDLIGDMTDQAFISRYTTDFVPPPGAYILGLPPEKRKILSELKSDDLVNIRWPRPDGINLEKLPRNAGKFK